MASAGKSRWADDAEDAALEAQRKRDKEKKRRAKAEKQRRLEAAEATRQQAQTSTSTHSTTKTEDVDERAAKRRRLSPEPAVVDNAPTKLLQFPALEWTSCRHVDNFDKLNHIEEGSYGWVSRAKEVSTGEVVALKKLKMENSNDGFPVTGLREIQTLMVSNHINIVKLREVVMGEKLDE